MTHACPMLTRTQLTPAATEGIQLVAGPLAHVRR